jgi:hypothetical protein
VALECGHVAAPGPRSCQSRLGRVSPPNLAQTARRGQASRARVSPELGLDYRGGSGVAGNVVALDLALVNRATPTIVDLVLMLGLS